MGVSREKCQRLLVFLSIPSAQRAPWDQDVCGRCDLDPRPPLPGPSLALRTRRRSPPAEPKWRETSGGFSLPPMRWRVQKSARGEEAQVHGPPRCVPPPASPPLRPREKRPRAPLLAVGLEDAAEAERGGQRTRCERCRCGPLCWCWGRWRASASEVSEAPARRGRSQVCRLRAGKPGGRVLRGCAPSARGQPGAVGARSWGPSGARCGKGERLPRGGSSGTPKPLARLGACSGRSQRAR